MECLGTHTEVLRVLHRRLRGCAVVCAVSLRVYCERFKLSEFASKTLHEQRIGPRQGHERIRRKSPE